MNDRNSSKYNMYVTTEKFCKAETDVWKVIPAYGKAVNRLGEIIGELNKNNYKLQGDEGTSGTKSAKRGEMEQLADLIGGSVRAYASASGNQALKADANITLRQIVTAKETDADDMVMYLHELGTKHLAAASDYGLTQADLDSLATSVEHFNDLVGKPKLSIGESKATREHMDLLFKEADMILNEQLDNMGLRFAKTNPGYYSRYQSARNVVFKSAQAKAPALAAV